MPNICVECVKDQHLKMLVQQEGVIGDCSLCGEKQPILDSDSDRFFQLTKALVRFFYSEWEYNTHWGGENLETLFYGDDNIFFDISRSQSDEAYDELTSSITAGQVYEDYDTGVSLFAGYDEGVQNILLEAVSLDLDKQLLRIAEKLKTNNYFDFEKDIITTLKKYETVAQTPLLKDLDLYRARVGFKARKRKIDSGFEVEYHFSPHIGKDIAAPPPNLASNGRVNRPGVSYLYCATDKYTAIAEVRPHPQDKVSIAKFRINNDLNLYDLSQSKLYYFFESDKLLDDYKPFNTLGSFLNKPIPPSDQSHHYSITQLIADCIRQLSYAGIIFNSTVGDGVNVVLFNQNDADQIQEDAEIVVIEKVSYQYAKENIVSDEHKYG